MTKRFLLILVLFFSTHAFAQNAYRDSMRAFIKNYVDKHEVVKEKDRGHLAFFDIDENFKITAKFQKVANAPGLKWNLQV